MYICSFDIVVAAMRMFRYVHIYVEMSATFCERYSAFGGGYSILYGLSMRCRVGGKEMRGFGHTITGNIIYMQSVM